MYLQGVHQGNPGNSGEQMEQGQTQADSCWGQGTGAGLLHRVLHPVHAWHFSERL